MNNQLGEIQRSVIDLKKQVDDLKKKSSIEDIILNSEYKILTFFGNANGVSALTRAFDENLILNKNILIKGIHFFAYYVNDSEDVNYNAGATTEIIPAGGRVSRNLDTYVNLDGSAHFCRININGASKILNVITGLEAGTIPVDLSVDNIYSYHKDVKSIEIFLNTEVFETLTTPGTGQEPNVKVVFECYIS